MSDDTVGGERAISRVGAQAGAGGAGGAGVAGGGPGAVGQTTTPAPAASGPDTPTSTPPSDPPTVWHKGFAITSVIVLAVLLGAFVVVSQLFADNLGLDATETAKLDGRALIGARVIGPVTVPITVSAATASPSAAVQVTVTPVSSWAMVSVTH